MNMASQKILPPLVLTDEEINALFKKKDFFHQATLYKKKLIEEERYNLLKFNASKKANKDKLSPLEAFKKSEPFSTFHASAQDLIIKIALDLHKKTKETIYSSDTPNLEKPDIEKEDSVFSEKANLNDLKRFVAANPEISKIMIQHVNQIQKNRETAERWRTYAVTPLTLITTGLDFVEKKLSFPPVEWIVPFFKMGLDNLTTMAELKAMDYDPDLQRHTKIQQKAEKLSIVGSLAAIAGIMGLIAGGAATGVAFAPIAFFVAASAMMVNNLVSGYSSVKNFIQTIKQKEPKNTYGLRLMSSGLKAVTSVNGIAFAVLSTAIVFAAIANPAGLTVAAAGLFIYMAATAAVGLFSYFSAKWAEKKVKEIEKGSVELVQTKTLTHDASPAPKNKDKPEITQTHTQTHTQDLSSKLAEIEATAAPVEPASPGRTPTFTPDEGLHKGQAPTLKDISQAHIPSKETQTPEKIAKEDDKVTDEHTKDKPNSP